MDIEKCYDCGNLPKVKGSTITCCYHICRYKTKTEAIEAWNKAMIKLGEQNDTLHELKKSVNDYFHKVTDEELKSALKNASYEEYTGIDPYKLSLHTPIINCLFCGCQPKIIGNKLRCCQMYVELRTLERSIRVWNAHNRKNWRKDES